MISGSKKVGCAANKAGCDATSINTEEYYSVSLALVKKCAQLIKKRISSRVKQVEIKSIPTDLLTETDKEVEKTIIEGLSKSFPDHKFIGEESVGTGGKCNLTDAFTWILDPIDGTMNFVHSFPHCCISLALFMNKAPVIGIIYNPMLEQLFTAQKGKGAFLNGNKITVSDETELSKSLIMMESGGGRKPEKRKVVSKNMETLIHKIHGFRNLGSAALNMSMVALGAADAYVEFGIHIWDIAAAELIVTEAGGVVMDPAGEEIDRLSGRVLAASNRDLAKQIYEQLDQFYPDRD